MNYKTYWIKVVIASSLILAASIYYGTQSQYFGKELSTHIQATAIFMIGIAGLIWVSEWYKAKTGN